MTTLCIQIQPHRAATLNLETAKALCSAIASDRELVSRFEVVEGVDGEPYTNLIFETARARQLWARISSEIYGNKQIRDALLQASIATCEGNEGWNNYRLLHHFDAREKLDSFQQSPTGR